MVVMPKLKTRKAAAKRYQVTGSGKIRFRRAGKNHLLQHKSSKRKRSLSGMVVAHPGDAANIELQMPYSF